MTEAKSERDKAIEAVVKAAELVVKSLDTDGRNSAVAAVHANLKPALATYYSTKGDGE